jgi:hypothetical protein
VIHKKAFKVILSGIVKDRVDKSAMIAVIQLDTHLLFFEDFEIASAAYRNRTVIER